MQLISKEFCEENNLEIHPTEKLTDCTTMNGSLLGYDGYVEVNVQIPGRDFSEDHLFLVTSEISHQKEIPVVVGTHNLQLQDALCQKKAKQVKTNTDMSNSYYIDTDGVLRKLWQDNEEVFSTILLPKILIDPVLQLAHDSAGHNGFQWVYLSIRQLYYWNNMKKDILHHCKHCAVCEKLKME